MAVTEDEVRKLATLARIKLTEAEIEKLRGEIDSILAYVDTIQKVELPEAPAGSAHLDIENVMREDADPDPAGVYAEALLAQAPSREGRFVKVKKILG